MRWAQLRVGLTVIFALITLGVLVFLMTGTTGLFTSKLELRAYFDQAEGLRVGAPVRLQGVDIGNVSGITIVPDRPLTPVQVTLNVSTKFHERLRQDSIAVLSTAGVLGETFVNIDSRGATGEIANDGDELKVRETPGLEDVVRSSQTTLQNLDIVLKRMDNIVASIERGEGSVGKFLYDPSLFNRMDATLKEMQVVVNRIAQGQGTVGKLLRDEDLYDKLRSTVDRMDALVTQVQAGQGTIGKLMQDPTLYNQASETLTKANQLMTEINQGKGALGLLTSDPQFAAKVDNLVTRMSALATSLQAGEGTLGRLLQDESIYTNTDQMLVETRNLMRAIRENPKRYLTIRFRLF